MFIAQRERARKKWKVEMSETDDMGQKNSPGLGNWKYLEE